MRPKAFISIRGIAENEFSRDLPVLLMTSKLRLASLLNDEVSLDPTPYSSNSVILLWLAGLCSEELLTSYQITLIGRPSDKEPDYNMHMAGELSSLRDHQDPASVYLSGNCLILNRRDYQGWSRNKRELLKLELSIH